MKRSFSALALFVVACMITVASMADTPVTITVDSSGKAISPDLFGIFFEDLNYAADGGLYPERVQNRSFEYSRGDNQAWNSLTAWQLLQSDQGAAEVTVESEHPLHPNNPHYAILNIEKDGDRNGLQNEGFDGIVVTKGDKYNISLYARVLAGSLQAVTVRVETSAGDGLGEARLTGLQKQWTKHTAVIEAKADAVDARLVVLVSGTGSLGLDMISLFPQKTFKNRPNGLRPDLAQVIADLKPRFVRFPGGCLAHGDGLENMYRWKETIGPIEHRKAQRNIWRYHQTLGLGYFEYFQFCEDIGAKPLPVVPAGVCCQNSGNHLNLVPRGQQGLPMDQMAAYVQEVLDLVEYANGPADSEWGSKRAAAGHPEPFNLKYLGVGNEDIISEVFKERYKMINDAVKARYPDIVVIGTTGPFTDGRDYEEGWKFARQEKLPMVDEHGYKSPQWFWENLERFDAYERGETLVYLGEYAAHDTGRANTLRSALSEAAYMTGLERNGDLVRFSSYAPLLAKQNRTQWRPDLIYFDNTSITLSTNYYVQQLFGLNSGDVYLPTTLKGDTLTKPELKTSANGVLLGTYNTQAKFDNLEVVSDGQTVLSESFDGGLQKWQPLSGEWTTTDGACVQRSGATPALTRYPFNSDTGSYTVSVRAMKTDGAEGFLVGFGSMDAENYYWLNLGGWNNTRYAIEKAVGGGRSTVGRQIDGRVEPNRWYDVKIQVTGKRIRCFVDGRQIIDLTDRGFIEAPDVAASTVRDTKTGDVIVKIVSKADKTIPATIDLKALGTFAGPATCTVLTGDALAENRFGRTPAVLPQTSEIRVSSRFEYAIPPHSLSVIRITRK